MVLHGGQRLFSILYIAPEMVAVDGEEEGAKGNAVFHMEIPLIICLFTADNDNYRPLPMRQSLHYYICYNVKSP